MKPLTGIAICLLAGVVWAQSDGQLTPRQIFDFGVKTPERPARNTPAGRPAVPNPPPVKPPESKPPADKPPATPPPAPETVPLALRYSILQDKNGSFQEVDPDTPFHSRDRIRVRVESNRSAYLYIVMIGSSGQSSVLFPNSKIDGGNNRVPSGRPYTIPPENEVPFVFDDTAGVEKISLVLTRTPVPDLENLIYAAGDPARLGEQHRTIVARNNAIDGAVLGGMRDKLAARDLVIEKYDGTASDGKPENAVYAATKDNSPDATLFVDLKLTHK